MAALAPDALVGVFYDDGLYVVLARSLAEGHGYRFLHLPDAPAAVHYPFGYPAFLAALWRLWPSFPENVALLRGANAALMGVFAFVTTAALGERVLRRSWLGALVVALASTAIPLAATATVLFAEPLFLALAALACWQADVARGREGAAGLGLALAAGLVAGLATLTRSIGVAVIAGVVLALRKRPALSLSAGLAAAATLLPWLLWVRAHRSGVDPLLASNYGTYGDLAAQSGWSWLSPASVVDVVRPLAALALPAMPLVPFALAAMLLALIFALGLAALGRRAPAVAWTLGVYLLIATLWPYGPDRFVWAALPWIALATVAGLAWLLGSPAAAAAARAWRWGAGVAAAALLAAGFLAHQARGFARGLATSEQRGISETMQVAVDWVLGETDSASVVASEDEALIWLYTGRRAVPSHLWRARGRGSESLGADSLHAFFRRSGVTHVLLTGPRAAAAPTLDRLVGRYPGFLNLVRVWPWGMLAFRVEGG
jgi:hypothetical protein